MAQMRNFLKENFGTTNVQDIDFNLLKEKLDGPALLSRINYRRKTGFLNVTKKDTIEKG
jgi:hypothetical protein